MPSNAVHTLIDQIDTISLLQIRQRGDVLVIDARSEAAFKSGHLVGAVSMPLASLREKLSQLSETARRNTVIYGISEATIAKELAGLDLTATHLMHYDHLNEWKSCGLPLDILK